MKHCNTVHFLSRQRDGETTPTALGDYSPSKFSSQFLIEGDEHFRMHFFPFPIVNSLSSLLSFTKQPHAQKVSDSQSCL
jgi:hypothetical protein